MSSSTPSSSSLPSSSSIQHAIYPLPQPLALILSAAVSSSSSNSLSCNKESTYSALAQLVGNAIRAVDRLYFETPSRIRSAPWFVSNRTCLRIHVSPNSLSITDLGIGMTRADLINSLGIGRSRLKLLTPQRLVLLQKVISKIQISNFPTGKDSSNHQGDDDHGIGEREDNNVTERPNHSQHRSNGNVKDTLQETNGHIQPADKPLYAEEEAVNGAVDHETDEGTADTDDDDVDDFDEDIDIEDDDEEEEDGDDDDGDGDDNDEEEEDKDTFVVSCTEADIGGFYSSFCSLAVGVTIGTKSKFDDYYEFSFGKTPSNPEGSYSHFTVTRPMNEGTKPTVENGYTSFSDVRGESGTRVTLYGTFDEQEIRPLVAKIMATSQYTFAFAGDDDEASIIAASKIEEEALAQLSMESTSNVEDDSDLLKLDMTSSTPITRVSAKERAKYIPVRLTLGERKMLRLVEAAMTCCDYTTAVDSPNLSSAARRTHAQLQGISAILRGLVTACDYSAGQRLSTGEDELEQYHPFFQKTFEIARRHKIMNPEKMRTEYGKLIYLLQDAVSPTVQQHLGFSVVGPILTVYEFLKERGGLKVLDDKLIDVATDEIDGRNKTRMVIRAEIKRKEKAVETIKAKYRSTRLTEDDIHLALYSIGDNNSFLYSDRVPIDRMIAFLQTLFSPATVPEGYSLSIASGENGARLSHSHERQFLYAMQSLTLWRDIMDDMFRLWQMAEDDLLSETVTYSLQDTGQGFQRVQQSPRTYRAMQQVLQNVQRKKDHQWIGSSVIHLGDHNVPNALSFIDKYTQVPRILRPIVACLDNLENLYKESSDIQQMVDTNFGGLEKLVLDILHDFFRSAFDGSGADNFYDAGSCIDGRLTSAWNWCSQLPAKPFYIIFKLTGFIGFDGDFK